MEKRSTLRRRISSAIVCSRLRSHPRAEEIEGILRNCCENGFAAELRAPVPPGTILLVRSAGRAESPTPARTMALAEVRWLKIRPRGNEIWYEAGLRYLPSD
ncbi:MAG: hypothetical protein WHT06_01205 [Desulfobacterales bacterium]